MVENKQQVFDEIKRIQEQLKTGPNVMRTSFLTAAFDAILHLNERLSLLEESKPS